MIDKQYDIIIVGGGLAGLSLAILLRQKNFSVLVIEKKSYPYHKVCGEYISMESWNFLSRLGIQLYEMNVPKISMFQMTAISGKTIEEDLDMGGFGISRFSLDKLLADKAKDLGVKILENTLCMNYKKIENSFIVNTSKGDFQSVVLCASFGRYSFGNFYKPLRNSENWIGVKYHIKTNFQTDTIALHTFKHGYCGISKIENECYCLCYLVKASLLKSYHNNIEKLEQGELYKNPFLKKIFTEAKFIFEKPITISNVTFNVKKPLHDHVFYLGDSAGAITPLTGNGMSNAMRSAHLLSIELDKFLHQKTERLQMEESYLKVWNKEFKQRIFKGRVIQYFFCNFYLTSFFIAILSKSKWLRKTIIKQTHGDIF